MTVNTLSYIADVIALVGSSEGYRPKYSLEEKRKLGLTTENILLKWIDWDKCKVTVTFKSVGSAVSACMVASMAGVETTEVQAISKVLDNCNKFKAKVSKDNYTIVAGRKDSDMFITLEGEYVSMLCMFGLPLRALHKRVKEEEDGTSNTGIGHFQ